MKTLQIHPVSALLGALVVGGAILVSSLRPVAGYEPSGLTSEQERILSHLSIVYLHDGAGNRLETIRVSDVNLQIVNGLEATNGYPTNPQSIDPALTRTNGVGNLILGYGETGGANLDRTGSHSLVLGTFHSYSSFGSVLAGSRNSAVAPHSSAVGGTQNAARGNFAVAVGGAVNEARGSHSATIGGGFNWASGDYSVVTGAVRSVAGGQFASVSGGYKSIAIGDVSSVHGGAINRAEGTYASVSGGSGRVAPDTHDWAAGALFQDN